MILPLRQRHRRIFAVIGVLLPVAFVVGIAARKAMPLRAEKNWVTELREAEKLAWERSDLFSQVPVRVRLLCGPGWYRIGFSAGRGFAKPDLLVYWVAGQQSVSETLPDQAILLGPFDPSLSLQLPPDTDRRGGAVVLYSLADQEIVDWSKPIPAGELTK
ncbi:MAG: hypothetical protein EPO07_09450 [Verrucomicrobia bacterium]|nr:MAG: hypothetical protein EPO07_09450 [Verrucomicrobiota bacterium]